MADSTARPIRTFPVVARSESRTCRRCGRRTQVRVALCGICRQTIEAVAPPAPPVAPVVVTPPAPPALRPVAAPPRPAQRTEETAWREAGRLVLSFVSFVAAMVVVLALVWTVGTVVPQYDDNGNADPAPSCVSEPANC